MRRGFVLLLLLSLGLNVGLGYQLVRRGGAGAVEPASNQLSVERAPGYGSSARDRRGPHDFGPALVDSARWEEALQRRLRRLKHTLDLEPATWAALERVQRENAETIRALGARLYDRRLQLRAAVMAADRDPEQIRRTASDLAAAQSRLDSAVVEAVLSELMVLPASQQEHYLASIPWQRWGRGPYPDGMEHGAHGRGFGRRGDSDRVRRGR
jgi:hypothetical protein